MCVMTTRMFTHTGPRRGDVFAESTFAKQIAMIEGNKLPPVVKVGNLDSLRTWADVRDAVRAYHMLVTINPTPGAYYNIGGQYTCTIRAMLDALIGQSTCADIRVEVDPERLRRSTPICKCPIRPSFIPIPGGALRYPLKPRCAICLNIGASASTATRASCRADQSRARRHDS